MVKKNLLLVTIALLCALAQGAWAQGEFGNLPNTVSGPGGTGPVSSAQIRVP